MLQRLLVLGDSRVRAEQVRLLLANVGTSVVPTIVLVLLLVWTLRTDANARALTAWGAATLLSKFANAYHARRELARTGPSERSSRAIGALMLLNALDGAAWGCLPWVALEGTSVAGSVLVIAVMAGVTSNAMSVLSPVLPVFLAFGLVAVTALTSKLWRMEDPAYVSLGFIAALYVATLVAQARISAIAARAAIDLRFENLGLVERLRQETEKAQAAHREAQEANLAKSKFLAAASHDLRQPIHAQGLFLEALARSDLSPPQREMLDSARATSEASSEMLNILLDFSRIEAGVVQPQARPFHLQTLLNKVESELAAQAMAKGLVFRVRETSAAVESDPVLVELILRNLVTNAIRYTEEGGILIACRKRNKRIAIEVWDTGIGIAPAQRSEIFREFHQLGNPERDRHKGLGLGLAIADRLAQAMALDLSVESAPGRGSVFRLSLPVTHAAVTIDDTAGKPYEICALHARVLVIDDDAAVRAGMLHLLSGWGCECEAVDSIEDAVAVARLRAPDIVVADYRLRQERTGAEAITRLRAALGRDLPALLITGDTLPDRLREAHAMNVPLLHKPVSSSQLNKTLARLLVPTP